MSNIIEIAKNAKYTALKLASLHTDIKNNALAKVADALENAKNEIFKANQADLAAAEKLVVAGKLSKATFGRLKLDENKLRDMIQGIRDVQNLPDPINQKLWGMKLDENLDLYKVSCPIGLIGVIFEARPDVIAQISALAIKSSNAVILKGGKESVNTNKVIYEIIINALKSVNFPDYAINQVFTREDVAKMLALDEYIDLMIPRGGKSLVRFVKENTKIPVLGHADGICHIYVDKFADLNKATQIIVDAKTQYPTACNAVETVLVHKDVAQEFIPKMYDELRKKHVLVKGCYVSRGYEGKIRPLSEDWACEYSDLILAVKVVSNVLDAINHINTYGSGHTDCIVTEDSNTCELFMESVDSSGVYCNASTRFADGFRYGFGAEVGISTSKTHARGPVGLEGLTIYKYRLYGDGQVVGDYVKGKKTFKHEPIEI